MKRTWMIIALLMLPSSVWAQEQEQEQETPPPAVMEAPPAQACAATAPALVIGQNSKFAVIMQKSPDAQDASEKALVADFLKDYATANMAQAQSVGAVICTDDKAKVTECLPDCATLPHEKVALAPYVSEGMHSAASPAQAQQGAAVIAQLTAKWAPWLMGVK